MRSATVFPAAVIVLVAAFGCGPGPAEAPPPEVPVTEPAPPPSDGVPAPVEEAAEAWALGEGVAPADVRVVSYEEVEWPDACLGVTREGEMCAQMITPGWRVVLEVGGETVELHTNRDASEIRRAGV